ncbi:DNA-directed RNA polymerase subunit beta [Candidatus Absconditicoccus praedator]|uniref:DNA-directed RNA polymerase subunit beta n=1 Tax=Candidatus Absconditicoccus praedator TaxID=2735562 RepID=UPI001E43F2E3|nr:DNA-directed RNA polymerase subunit beta [Candidatus Absconditicoccus praedator]UFX82529.1 DNA-directed RNA polymerase subunit beta [Candidatus Absconditicoccus praedator]
MSKDIKSLGIQDFGKKNGRYFLSTSKNFADFPDLLGMQKKGFDDFLDYYLNKLFDEINPIQDIAGEKLHLYVHDIKVSNPSEDIETCKKKELTYGGIISAKVKLVNNQTRQTIFNRRVNIGTLPLMTQWGSYIINGVERVIISQIVRSYGIFYSFDKKDYSYSFKLIPENGSWVQIFTEKAGNIIVRINKSRKFPVTALLRVFGFETDDSIKELFKDVLDEEDFDFINYTLEKDTTQDALDAAVFIYNKIRPGEIIDPENALDYVRSIFMHSERISLGRIARRKINAKLGLNKSLDDDSGNVFDANDMVESLKYLINLANRKRGYYVDDIDHLSNRRIRTTGEVLYAHLQPIMRKFLKSVKGKLSILNLEEQIKITDLVNFKMLDNSIKSFFATSQLSQFLDQINPLADIEHKRRITALGPGGLKRETTTFEVRDIHQSHYGRICPIETPEGQNIGLVIYQALYSRTNEDGFLEVPAVKVENKVSPKADSLVGRIADDDITDEEMNVIIKDGAYISQQEAEVIESKFGKTNKQIPVRPFLTDQIEYISPEYDEKYIIADVATPLDDKKNILNKRVAARHFTDMEVFHVNDITHMDVNPSQVLSANTSLIPFVEYDDAVRAAMGTNMQRQALPLIKPEAPLVGTGLEGDIAEMTYAVIKAEGDGEVIYVDGKRIKVQYESGELKEYNLENFKKSNQKSVIHQHARVSLGEKVQKGDVLAEGPSIVNGEVALGKNLRTAFMSWEGYNYEDAIVISQRLVKDDELTSIHIEEHEVEVAETKLGPEETTNDIPGVSMNKLTSLDEDGIVRIGSTVKGGDILVGKITPKGEGDLSPEEKLIQAIFGDKSKSYKDTSLYMPSGSEGKVVNVVTLDAQKGDNIPAGVKKKIKLYIASKRKIEVGDKLAGRHGNKGIISIVVPEEDMPFTKDGEPIDIILNPLGVVSRMNIGQTLETQLGMVAKALGINLGVPLFSGFGVEGIKDLAKKAGLPEDGKLTLYDGRTGEAYDNKVTVGYMNILKLVHMVDDKIHARSVGPYSLITQQPLGGKAREGGQRFGEMEVWALEAYSAVYTLQEMLTIKSDDVMGRNKTYDSIIKGMPIKVTGLPESFNFLVYVLKGIGQNITPLTKEEIEKTHNERTEVIKNLALKGITSVQTEKEEKEKTAAASDEEKKEIMDNVMQELEDYGEIDSN